MPRLCFKTRKSGRTVQLVRHVYDPRIQRSRTLTIGSLPLDADPEDYFHDLRLRKGVSLSDEEHRQITTYLAVAGDPDAARRRKEAALRIEERVRTEVVRELNAQPGDVFAQAVHALKAVITALPALAAQIIEQGEDVRAALRPGYLKIHAAWEELMKVAQDVGVAKRAPRGVKTPFVHLPDPAGANSPRSGE